MGYRDGCYTTLVSNALEQRIDKYFLQNESSKRPEILPSDSGQDNISGRFRHV